MGAFVTTFGPGEPSAYCGQLVRMLSFAKSCMPWDIQITVSSEVMTTGRQLMAAGVTAMKNLTLMHHCLGTGDFGREGYIVREISGLG